MDRRVSKGGRRRRVSLTLLDAASLPTARPALANIRCRLDPTARYAGLLTDNVLLRVYQATEGRLRPAFAYPLPPSATEFALHPDGRSFALTTSEQIQRIDHRTDSVKSREVTDRAIKALLFSRCGSLLWVGTEDSAGQNQLMALDARSLAPIATVDIDGIYDSHHWLSHHPTLDLIAVEVSCGQDGSWVNFVERSGGEIRRRDVGLARENDPLFFAGFCAEGDRFVGITQDAICAWSWPSCEPISAHPIDPESILHWQGTFIDNAFVAPISDGEEERFRLRFLDAQALTLLDDLGWEARDQRYLIDIFSLADGSLLLIGDRRLGLFRLDT